MNRIQKKCNPVQGVGWGQVPTVQFQIGPRYRSLLFEIITTGARAAQNGVGALARIPTICDVLDLIVLKVNGNPQRTHRAWELDQIQRSYGAQYAINAYNYDGGTLHYTNAQGQGYGIPDGPVAGKQTVFYLTINFREPWRKSYAVADMFCWPTAWSDGSVLSSFTCELTVPPITPAPNSNIDLGANGATPAPLTINCYSETDNQLGSLDTSTKKPVMLINRWERDAAVYGGSGQLVITTLPKKDILSQVSFFSGYKSTHADTTPCGPIAGNTPAQILLDQNDLATPAFDAITSAKVEVNSVTIRDNPKQVSDQLLIDDDMNEAALPPDRLDVIFDKSDRPDDGLVLQAGGTTVQDFVVTLNIGLTTGALAVATNKSVITLRQSYGPLAGGS